jgi:hypothetical protein
MRYIVTLLMCLLPFVLGCGQRQTSTDLGGVRFTLFGQPSQMNVVDDTATAKVAGKTYNLAVASGKLSVNGADYGPVAKGDDVKITAEKITINGKTANPIPDAEPPAP